MDLALYQPYYSPGLALVTCMAVNRESVLDSPEKIHLLRTVLRDVKERYAFRLIAFAFLPSRMHLMIATDGNGSRKRLLAEVSSRYAEDYQSLMGLPKPITVWSEPEKPRHIESVQEFAVTLDTIHYEPVRVGLVKRPEEWPHTSYESWVERSIYKLGWGWEEPKSIHENRLV